MKHSNPRTWRACALVFGLVAACGSNNAATSTVDAGNDPMPDAAGSDRGSGSNGSGAAQQPGVTISGTVTGLGGAGLVLADNGGDELAVTHDGTFTFQTQVQPGGAYDVSVVTEPSAPAQICTVANASGVATTNVTNVSVTCTTSSFTIGGSVVGLSGTGLVLQDNGGDNLAIAANGAFTFAAPVPSGGTFAVTIATQPTGPAQTCTLVGNTGTVGNGSITTVVVNCSTNSFAVGGTAVGLAGSVQLENDGGDSITVTSSGSFAFPTPLPSGTPYSVTVARNPAAPDQVCTVTNGSGTIGSTNVSNVVVSCVTQTFAIGGTLSGLAASAQITLKDNGGDPLTLSANGTFQFSAAVPSGQTYAVTTSAQPAGETCTVTSGTGTVGSANVTNVRVACVAVPYAVDVVVTGLTGGTLVLEDNGGDPLAITADGTYAFATKIDSGDRYDVAIAAQPAGAACTVSGGTGTIGAMDALAIVSCGSSGSGSGSGSASNCPLPATYVVPMPDAGASAALFTAGSGVDAITYYGESNTATCSPWCVDFQVDVLAGGGTATPDFPTLAPTSGVELTESSLVDANALIFLIDADNNVLDAYLATSGVLDVNALGTAGATFSGSVVSALFTHYLYDPVLGVTTPALDGCTTNVSFTSFAATETAD